jgi:hypothetical protein
MSSLVIGGDTSGTVTLQAPAVAGTTILTLPTTSGTLVTTAGGTVTIATNVAGGLAGNIHYQSAPSTTAFVTNGTSGQYLQSAGAGTPVWATITIPVPTGSTLYLSQNFGGF